MKTSEHVSGHAKTRFRIVSLFLIQFSCIALGAADPAYIGKWKGNDAKSDFGETTVTYALTPSNEMQATMAGQSYTFKTDGKEYDAGFGLTASWTHTDPGTWQTTYKINGKVLSTDTRKLSADGKTLTNESRGTRPDGTSFVDTYIYERVSGNAGLVGKWKVKKIKSSPPYAFEFTSRGPDSLTWNNPSEKGTWTAKFDGKDYPATGATYGPGYTVALEKTGPSSLEMSIKYKGKPLYVSNFAVSADGQTLTETGTAVETGEKYKAVFDRQ